MQPQFSFTISKTSFAIGERVGATLTAVNPGPELIRIDDPSRTIGAIRLFLSLPGGVSKIVEPVGLGRAGGSPVIPSKLSIAPGGATPLEWDLSQLAPMTTSGKYQASLEVLWAPNQYWRSEPVPFEIGAPTGTGMTIFPADGSQIGIHFLCWTEKQGSWASVFKLEFTTKRPVIELAAAAEIAHIHPDSQPVFSVYPPRDPMASRWLAWLGGGSLHAIFASDAEEERFGPVSLPMAAGLGVQIVSPLLSEGPGEERPGCMLGLITGGLQLRVLRIAPAGQFAMAGTFTLPGRCLAAWATRTDTATPVFVLAVAEAGGYAVYSAAPSSGDQGTLTKLLSAEGEFMAGGARSGREGSILVAVLDRGGNTWTRRKLTVESNGRLPGKVTESQMNAGLAAKPVALKLDETGFAHCLLLRENILRYFAPDSTEQAWTGMQQALHGKYHDLFIPPGPAPRPVLFYYDTRTGPTSVKL